MRVKSRWFRKEREKSPQEIAGAMAFILWKLAQNAVKSMRRADFEIQVGPQYFDYLAEMLIFEIQVTDRIAYEMLIEEERSAFTTELALRVADNFSENENALLGKPFADCRRSFIDLLNKRSSIYAECGFTGEGPDFSFLRYLGHAMLEHADERDKSWLIDQATQIEAPEAVATISRAMKGLFDESPMQNRLGSGIE